MSGDDAGHAAAQTDSSPSAAGVGGDLAPPCYVVVRVDDDLRTGLYRNDPIRPDVPGASDVYVLFDGQSIVVAYRDLRAVGSQICEYRGHAPHGIYRFAARARGDFLEARYPCVGWRRVGMFEGERLLWLDVRGGLPLYRTTPLSLPRCAYEEWMRCRAIWDEDPGPD